MVFTRDKRARKDASRGSFGEIRRDFFREEVARSTATAGRFRQLCYRARGTSRLRSLSPPLSLSLSLSFSPLATRITGWVRSVGDNGEIFDTRFSCRERRRAIGAAHATRKKRKRQTEQFPSRNLTTWQGKLFAISATPFHEPPRYPDEILGTWPRRHVAPLSASITVRASREARESDVPATWQSSSVEAEWRTPFDRCR